MATKTAKFCVMAYGGEDAAGRAYGFGDGITRSSRRLYAICDSREEAEAALARLMRTKTMTRARIPGDGIIYPDLTVEEFDALMFVGRQDRDQYAGLRLKNLHRDLYEQAEAAASSL